MSERDLNIGGDSTGSVNNTGDYAKINNYIITNSSVTITDVDKQLRSETVKPWEIEGVTLHNLPYARNLFFTGRESVLEELHNSLTGTGNTALSQPALAGLGGIGKTQIALEYVYRHIAQYKAVFWVKAESETTLTSDYLQIARLLDHPAKDHEDSRVVVEAVRRWLQTHEGWLLVYDNADEPDILNPFLPTAHKGRILLTSRKTAFGAMASAIEITEMEAGEAVTFLLKRCRVGNPSEGDIEVAGKVCSEMGYLPLALDQAGAFIEKTHCSLEDYLKMFREAGLEVLNDSDYKSGQYEYTVATTWLLSIQKVREECLGAEDILKLSAFLAPDDIPIDLFVKGAEFLEEPLKSIVSSSFERDKALGTLLSYSLISRKTGASEFSMHRLVQAVIRDRLDESERHAWVDVAIASANVLLPDVTDYRHRVACSLMVPHAVSIAENADRLGVVSEDYGYLLNQIGYYLNERAVYDRAEFFYRRALQVTEEAWDSSHPNYACSLSNLGLLYQNQAKYDKAEPLLVGAIRIAEELFGTRHAIVAIYANNLGTLYSLRREYVDAHKYLKQALEIDAQTYGSESLEVAKDLNNVGLLFKSQRDYAKAASYCLRALKITEKCCDSNDPELAISLTNLGGLYGLLGKYDEAERLSQRALKIDEAVYDANHPQIATDLNNLALILYETGRRKEAISKAKRAFDILSAKFDTDHPNVRNLRKALKSWGVDIE